MRHADEASGRDERCELGCVCGWRAQVAFGDGGFHNPRLLIVGCRLNQEHASRIDSFDVFFLCRLEDSYGLVRHTKKNARPRINDALQCAKSDYFVSFLREAQRWLRRNEDASYSRAYMTLNYHIYG